MKGKNQQHYHLRSTSMLKPLSKRLDGFSIYVKFTFDNSRNKQFFYFGPNFVVGFCKIIQSISYELINIKMKTSYHLKNLSQGKVLKYVTYVIKNFHIAEI